MDRDKVAQRTAVLAVSLLLLMAGASLDADAPDASDNGEVAAPVPHLARKLKAIDADNRSVLINRPGMITLVIGTNADSQDGARAAGQTVYSFQGRPDFLLIVVVDLRNSMATWVPSVVTSQMRSSLDQEAIELKPYYLKNGNKSNPRANSYVIPDFSGTICPQLGWPDGSDNLRGILFGADGNELRRWNSITDMAKLQNDVRAAIQALVTVKQAKAAAAAKTQSTKLVQPPKPPPPLPPPVQVTKPN